MSNSALAVIFIMLFLCLTENSNSTSNSNESCEFPEGMCLCYNELEKSLFASEANRINLTTTFFPLEDNPPEFVIVEYCFKNSSKTQLWFWSAFTSHFLYPFEVFQFSSLFFGKPEPYYRSQERLKIILENECVNLPSTDIKLHLLTQRLKYYAASGSSSLTLRDTYGAKAYNEETLTDLLKRNSNRIMSITTCTFFFVVVLSIAIVVCVLCSSICTKSLKSSELLKKMKDYKSVVFALAVLSLIANIYIICLAIAAVDYWRHQGEDEIRKLFHNIHQGRNSFPLGFALTVDIVCLGFWIGIVIISIYVSQYNVDYNIMILSLTVLCPIFCIIVHSPYIAIAYLDDGSHASSILIYYLILAYVMFGLSWLFFHWCENFEEMKIKVRISGMLVILLFLFLCLVITITCYFVLIPINKSISDAPNRLVSIYQSGGFVIGSFLVYKIAKYFYRKKKDTIDSEHIHNILQERLPDPFQQQFHTIENIHEILKKRLPDPFQQQFHQLQQQYNQFQLELQLISDSQRSWVPVKNIQKQFFGELLQKFRQTEQELLQRDLQRQAQGQQQNQPQEDSQADCYRQTLHDLQQSLHDIQENLYKTLYLQPPRSPPPPPPTALSSTQTTQPPTAQEQSQPASVAVVCVDPPVVPHSSSNGTEPTDSTSAETHC